MTDVTWDHRRSRAILIGTATYRHLPSVPVASNSLARMQELLTSELCGWPPDRVSVFPNPRSPGGLPDRLVQLFSADDVRDVALFYFVGHGQVDFTDTLCLGLVNSVPQAARRKTTSLPFDDVRYALSQCRAKAKVVILDCCYAGLATSATLAADDVLDLTRGTGAYTLAATGEFGRAWFETENVSNPQTYFTKYFADVIERGITGEGEWLRLEAIFHETAEALAHDGKPVPTSRAIDYATRLVFARNAAAVPSAVTEGGKAADSGSADDAGSPTVPVSALADDHPGAAVPPEGSDAPDRDPVASVVEELGKDAEQRLTPLPQTAQPPLGREPGTASSQRSEAGAASASPPAATHPALASAAGDAARPEEAADSGVADETRSGAVPIGAPVYDSPGAGSSTGGQVAFLARSYLPPLPPDTESARDLSAGIDTVLEPVPGAGAQPAPAPTPKAASPAAPAERRPAPAPQLTRPRAISPVRVPTRDLGTRPALPSYVGPKVPTDVKVVLVALALVLGIAGFLVNVLASNIWLGVLAGGLSALLVSGVIVFSRL